MPTAHESCSWPRSRSSFHADAARKLLLDLGLTDTNIQKIAADRMVEVAVPFESESEGWEARIFPWEFVLAAATREARHGEALTVMRRLALPHTTPAARVPTKLLYVESTPGKLRDLYSFETERALVKSNLRAKEWHELLTPTLDVLEDTIRTVRPDIIHLAGFDSHQGLRLLRPTLDPRNAGQESPPRTESAHDAARDGYLIGDRAGAAGTTD